jgi:Rod binding domain-containing protein
MMDEMNIDAVHDAATPEAVQRGLRRLRSATGEVVGSVFYGTMLKAMRGSSLRGEYGHGGRGEDVFAAQLDAVRARQLGKASQGGLADTLYQRLALQQQRIERSHADQGEVTR